MSFYTSQVYAQTNDFNVIQTTYNDNTMEFDYNQRNRQILINPNFQPRTSVHVNPNFCAYKPNVHVNPNVFSASRVIYVNQLYGESRRDVYGGENRGDLYGGESQDNLYGGVGPGNLTGCRSGSLECSNDSSTMYKQFNPELNGFDASKCQTEPNQPPAKPVFITSKNKLIRIRTPNSKIKPSTTAPSKPLFHISKNKLVRIKTPNAKDQASSSKKIPMEFPRHSTLKTPLIRTFNRAKFVKNTFKLDNRLSEKSPRNWSKYSLSKSSPRANPMKWKPKKLPIASPFRAKKCRFTFKRCEEKNVAKKRTVIGLETRATTLAFLNKMRIVNIPCPIFKRFGKCKAHEKGICRRKHDRKLVNVCRNWGQNDPMCGKYVIPPKCGKFLQGECHDDNCTLSHNATLEKMPTCKFYLNGFCDKDHCVYLHVKLNENADICREFLNGFCPKADECNKRHEFTCPEFDKSGQCTHTSCSYPHVKRTVVNEKPLKYSCRGGEPKKKLMTKEGIRSDECDKNVRYYLKNSSENQTCELIDEENNGCVGRRDQLELLPEFIPFSEM